jgi:sulfatase maturation enzyme AslB (radical SAM superfamily)
MKPNNLASGICESGERFAVIPPVDPTNLLTSVLRQERALPPREGCGCALAVDPFTINETCTMGCSYCYAADKSLASKKRNTTKFSLPLA